MYNRTGKQEGFITLIGAIVLVLVFLMLFLFIQSWTLILCANWFPIVMIILALGVFYYLKNRSETPKRRRKR